jgi:geranylgeranyl diphosphate synthase type II
MQLNRDSDEQAGPQEDMIEALRNAVPASLPQRHSHAELSHFYTLLHDYPSRGGKHLRGQLVLLSTAAHGAPWTRALQVAVALELFQNWVLIHDDIEDGSETRRGLPTLHRTAGLPVALNVGDALHVYMWQVLHALEFGSSRLSLRILQEFTWMIHRTIEGQHLDLSWVQQDRFDVTEDEYLEMVTLKTAYYTVACPLRLGAFCAEAEPDHRLMQAGEALGVAFQIRDDVLNLMPGAAYGKEFAGDLYEGKRTLILAHLLAHVMTHEREEIISHLSRPRPERSVQQIERILAYIDTYGSLDYAQQVAAKRTEEGLRLLEHVTQTMPDAAVAQQLLLVLRRVHTRAA